MSKPKIVNNNITNNYYGKSKAKKNRRAKLRKKIRAKQALPPQAQPEDTVEQPKDLDLNELFHLSNACKTSSTIGCVTVHEPLVMFQRHIKVRRESGRHVTYFRDVIRFNDMVFERLGLQYGMRLALFADDLQDAAKYFLVQNVVRQLEAPAHQHRLGMYVLQCRGERKRHICEPAHFTEAGWIGQTGWQPNGSSVLDNLPQLIGYYLRLYRVKKTPDLFIGEIDKRIPAPTYWLDKMTRLGRLVESDERSRPTSDFIFPSQKNMRGQRLLSSR